MNLSNPTPRQERILKSLNSTKDNLWRQYAYLANFAHDMVSRDELKVVLRRIKRVIAKQKLILEQVRNI